MHLSKDSLDRWKWTIHKHNLFTVSSCYSYVMNLLDHSPLSRDVVDVLSILWKAVVPSKVVLFCWRLFLDRLPTKDNLIRRSVVITNSHCSLCDTHEESATRIFFHCDFSKAVWKEVLCWMGITDALNYDDSQHIWAYHSFISHLNIKKKM